MRTLGSFNKQVNLPTHREDYTPVAEERPATKTLQTGGYTLGIARNAPPNEGTLLKVETSHKAEKPPVGSEWLDKLLI
jgi:hypothetical protein